MDKEQQLNDLFAKARSQAPKATFEETKALFVRTVNASSNTVQKGKLFTLKNIIIMSISVFITATITLFFNWSKPEISVEKSEQPITQQIDEPEIEEPNAIQLEPISEPIQNQKISKIPNTIEPMECIMPTSLLPDLPSIYLFESSVTGLTSTPRETNHSSKKEPYRLPKLTDDEIKKTVKQKKKMMKDLMKPEPRMYVYIPGGSFEYMGEKLSVSAYYMQRTEVTNLEYRTFLFDLVMQNRLEDFLVAKPDEDMWIKMFEKGAKPMAELYFSHPAYDEYPVVNISRAGAELYCKWLYEEAKKSAGDKTLPYFQPRIPTREEWVNAASAQGKNPTFPWGGESIQNEKQCYLANHKPTDSTYFDDGGMFTVRVTSYTANAFGLFNMSGNVAEMVVDSVPNKIQLGALDSSILTPGTAGGGWMNTANEVKISAPDNHPKHTEAHPNIGFRVVMSRRVKGV